MTKRLIPVIAMILIIGTVMGCTKKADPEMEALKAQMQAMQAELDKAKSGNASAEEIAQIETAIVQIAEQEQQAETTAPDTTPSNTTPTTTTPATTTPSTTTPSNTTPSTSTTTSAGGFQMSGTTLTKYNGTSASVAIPNSVTSIGEGAFIGCTGLTGRFIEVLRPLADIMSGYESVPAQELRNRYDDMLPAALTSQPAIVSIFTVWKPNVIDGMDSRFIGRPGSTPTGQYAPAFARENGNIEKRMFTGYADSMAYINGPDAYFGQLKPTPFKVNGHWVLRIEIPIKNPRTNETVGAVGCYGDIR